MLVPGEGNRATYVVLGEVDLPSISVSYDSSSKSPASSEPQPACESMEEGDRNSSGHFVSEEIDLNKTVQADDFGKPSK